MKEVVIGNARLKALRRGLEEWRRETTRYCRAQRWKDFPWWYNERASVGMLALGFGKAGYTVLEEYSTDKTPPLRKGRQDLFIASRGAEFVAEAKFFLFQPTNRPNALRDRVASRLRQAVEEVRDKQGSGARRLAIAFVSLKARRPRRNVEDDTGSWIKELRELSSVAVAWVAPPRARRSALFGGYVFPACAVVIADAERTPKWINV